MSILDRYGNAIDNPPHNDVIVGSNGVPLPSRNILQLGPGLSATDTGTSTKLTISALVDVTSMDNSALAFANSVCNFVNPCFGRRLSMGSQLGTQGNPWRQNLGTSGTQASPTTGGGEGQTLSTGALSTTMTGQLTSDGAVGGQPWIPDLVLAANKWFVQWDFSWGAVAPTANAYLFLGWVASDDSLFGPAVGVFGAGSTTKFGFTKHNVATFTESTVSIDTSTHRARMWHNGSTPGTVSFSFDNETPVSIAGVTMGRPASPYWEFKCTDTAAAKSATLKTSYYFVEGELP